MRISFKPIITIILVLITHVSSGQQLDQIGKKDPIKVNGGLNVNQVYRGNATAGIDPYAIVVSGNVNTSIYGMSVPLTFTWSNNDWTYTQPFNQFSISPSYKWATAHLGWSSMSFSPYSLNGHSFAGVGLDLAPEGKFKFSAMYGQLLKGTAGDTLQGYDPRYERMGGGFKTVYTFKQGEVGVHFFKASDDTHKPVDYIDSLGVVPQDNLVLGTTFSIRPSRRISLRGEVSLSSLSNDIRLSKATDFNGIATHQYCAAKTDMSYSTSVGSIGAGVEYVEPGYNTLGSYYQVSDFINYTLNFATSILKGKVNAAANLGVRETNLSNQSETDQRDIIQNINIGFNPNEKLSFNATYSNFYNYSFIRPLFDETNIHTEYELLDTLSFTQINENIALNANWRLAETEQLKQSINMGFNFQQATQKQSDVLENSNSSFVNASAGYNYTLVESDLSLAANMNYSQNRMPESISEAYGPLVSVRKSMFEKQLKNSLSLSWNGTYVDKVKNGAVLTARLGSNYTLKKKHRFNLSVAWSKRNRDTGTSTSYTTATLGYSYQFGWPKKKEEAL